jgi:putative aminopeptidase FrvX
MNKLIEVLEVQSVSRNDKQMREYLKKEIATIEGVTFLDDGINIYATKGVAPYPCMVAHMDTVHAIQKNLTAVVFNGRITGFNTETMTQVGIGGDDKVGIYVALEMLKEHANIKCFFPKDEEIGCVGSAKVNKKFFDDVTIALQCDRRGNADFIFEAGGVTLSSDDFQEAVLPILGEYGYKFDFGMMTDVMELKEQGINISMANISCGYYNPHCPNEYVDVADVHRVTCMVSQIIKELGSTYFPHELPARDEFAWWEDDHHYGVRETGHIHNALNYCNDCFQKPASGPNGLCDECWNWYKDNHLVHKLHPKRDVVNFGSKPDYGQTRIIKPPTLIEQIFKSEKKFKKKRK